MITKKKRRFYTIREYGKVEKATFTPPLFLTNGVMGKECSRLNKRLSQLISIKREERYSDVMRFIRTKLRFTLLKSTLIAIRGFRNSSFNKQNESPMSDISFNLIPFGKT